MATQKIYAGSALRETRARAALTQRRFAEKLGVSLPYLSQMENNHRPISAGVLLRLAQEFGVDLTTLAAGDAERMVIDMQEALADPLFDAAPPLADLRLAATNAPVLARAFLDLYRAHREGQERLAALDRLLVNAAAEAPTRLFQLLHLVALERQSDLLEATLDLARFRSPTARQIARLGMANYFAGAALMPYRAFMAAAQAERHDLERLSHLFDASLEQVAHRLSTLQRPGAKGVPFFFVRVDQAGTITKRHSATRLQFARFGGACPLWNVHQAFEQPGRFLRQLAETPDGVRYLLLARDVSKHAGAFNAPVRRFAIGLGVEVAHAGGLVYADGLDLTKPRAYQPIGISCRICPRPDCHQRSVPPIDRPLRIPADRDGPLPYEIT
ncbi:short-chain fatty acyl-CoA regulator family protein [Paracoccus sp. 08]|uniref:helix-turn-helix domain-containing protein n=1 Tax=Paracoccus sp. 08 TaxID=2606624 RepID=UPI0020952F4B|nr:helix-turn-helix domain-containing protein [Paracoccus sp. 08]